ncbi:VIR protein [Plasmodium vivax]|uniref:VIR protein n=1 Tax=Plasmodium vivax TaxID=5855 RepID=A0A1G4EIK9_PLAVI|nr:VIR protein [Plasmodium vivax]
MRTVTVSSYAADTNLNEDVCLDTFGVVVEEIENKIEELKETFKTNKPQACVALNKYVIEKKLKLETCYDKSLLFLYLDSYDNIGDIIKECANQSQNLGDTGKQIKENSEPGPGIENLCKENDQCNPKSAKPKNPTEPSESTAVAEPGSPVKGHSHNLEEKSKIADIDSEPGLSSTFHADPIQTDTEISGLQADLSGKSLPLEGQPKSPLVEDNSSSGEAESSTRGFPDDKQLLTEKTPVLQDTIDANPREAHAKESSRGDSDIKTLRSLSNSEDSSAIPPPFVSGIVENTGVGSDHVKSVTRNVGNASDGVLSADGKVATIVTPESAVSVEKHSAAGSSVDRRFGTGNIHSEDTCGDSNGKSICKPDAREATICVNHGTEACRSETGGSETLVGASHDVHSPSFQGIPENASYTQSDSLY